jgi:hypothetical protein
VHSFLPIGLGIVILIYLANISFGWSPKDPIPEDEVTVFFMVIPVLVYLVYWFIFQSRYNVAKSGGKMSYGHEYLNFFLYALVFTVAYFFILVIPYSNDARMKMAVGHEEVLQDIENLNKGNTILNEYGGIEDNGRGTYKIWESRFVNYYYDYSFSDPSWNAEGEVILTKRQVLTRIENYLTSYNKYVRNENRKTAEQILADCLAGETYDSYGYGYYDSDWQVERKVSRIKALHEGSGHVFWHEKVFWQVSFAFILWLALLVWIFKQMNLRHFVFGFISLCLTPLFVGIVGAILFGVLYRRGNDGEELAMVLVFLAYIVVAIVAIRGAMQKNLNHTGYVLTMYLNFWLPMLPLFIYGWILMHRHYSFYYDNKRYIESLGMNEEDLVFWLCVAVCLGSIAAFKSVYAKFRSLPLSR